MKRLLGIVVLAATVAAAPAPAREQPDQLTAARTVPVYLAVDLSSHRTLAQREADRQFLPASMAKVMTAYVAFELIAQGKLRPERLISVRPETAALWATRGTGMRLKAGEQVSVDMLLQGITTVSANDASVVLAEGVAGSVPNWLALMNAEARELGMTGSRFGTPNGWPDGGATRVSARDMVKLGAALIDRHPQLYARYFGKKTLTWNGVSGQNRDPTIGIVPGADGIKTGHTREAGYNFLGTAIRDGRRIMIVVGGARSEAERAAAAADLLEWSFRAWETKPLFAKGATVGQARVQGGDARQVALVAPAGVNLTVRRGEDPKVSLAVRYRGPLTAPIAKGAEVARLQIAEGSQPVAELPLYARDDVGKAGPVDRLINGLAGLLP